MERRQGISDLIIRRCSNWLVTNPGAKDRKEGLSLSFLQSYNLSGLQMSPGRWHLAIQIIWCVCVRTSVLYTSQRQREKEVMFFERERSETKRVFFLHIVPLGHKAGPVQKGSDGALSARAAAVPGVNVSDI